MARPPRLRPGPLLGVVAALVAPALARSETAIREVRFSEVAAPPSPAGADELVLSWPFCPSDARCDANRLPSWIEVRVGLASCSARLKDPHDSIERIVSVSRKDMLPIAHALQAHLSSRGDTTLKSRAAWAQGLSQSIQYAFDTTTGFAEYPKFALEYLVDQKGDCDDAAVFSGALLDGLGLQPYFILWDPVKGNTGHISTGVERTGDLASVEPPPGSRLVKRPQGAPLLHVDGVGSEAGCRQGCGVLGWNECEAHGLRPAQIVAVAAPTLGKQLPIHVWRTGDSNPEHAISDKATPKQEVVLPPGGAAGPEGVPLLRSPAEQEAWEIARLQRMGLEPAAVAAVVKRRWGNDSLYLGLTGAVALGLLLAGVAGVREARRRRALARKKAAETKQRAF